MKVISGPMDSHSHLLELFPLEQLKAGRPSALLWPDPFLAQQKLIPAGSSAGSPGLVAPEQLQMGHLFLGAKH